MKKKMIILLASLFVLVGSVAWAGHAWDNFLYCLSSGELSSDTTVHTGPGFFLGVVIITDGTNDASATIYDNTENSGTEVWGTHTVIGANHIGGAVPPVPVYCATGIRLDVGSNTTAVVYYRKANSKYKIPVE